MKKTKHILQGMIKIFVRQKEEVGKDYSFDIMHGYWVNNLNKNIACRAFDFSACCTKKCDVETGEDLKGQ